MRAGRRHFSIARGQSRSRHTCGRLAANGGGHATARPTDTSVPTDIAGAGTLADLFDTPATIAEIFQPAPPRFASKGHDPVANKRCRTQEVAAT